MSEEEKGVWRERERDGASEEERERERERENVNVRPELRFGERTRRESQPCLVLWSFLNHLPLYHQ